MTTVISTSSCLPTMVVEIFNVKVTYGVNQLTAGSVDDRPSRCDVRSPWLQFG